jgi:hypothetical protein
MNQCFTTIAPPDNDEHSGYFGFEIMAANNVSKLLYCKSKVERQVWVCACVCVCVCI